ncbi:hypothetical protein LD112_24920 [Pantoea agglomerans]|nr:hypothetical protein [Pantoea agglomerans]
MSSVIVQPQPTGAASPVAPEDIARVLGRYCLIRLDMPPRLLSVKTAR